MSKEKRGGVDLMMVSKKCIVVVSIVCIYVPSTREDSSVAIVNFKAFCERVIPWLAADSDHVICTGYVADSSGSSSSTWAMVEESLSNAVSFPKSFSILPFSYNAGKSAYVNRAMRHVDDVCNAECIVVTIDCDMFPVEKPQPWRLSDLVSVLLVAENHQVGIVAPQQVPATRCRHANTVFEKSMQISLIPRDDSSSSSSRVTLWWSTKHPSIAGGMWAFRKSTVYDKTPGGFADVGIYGPEDVLFAAHTMCKLHLQCCLVPEFCVMHELENK